MTLAKNRLDLKELKQKLFPVFQKTTPIRRVVVFGSMAREAANMRSDVDLVVDSKEELLGLALFSLADDIRTILNRKIDLFEACEIIPGTELHKNIEQEGVVIYER
jgi:predicted nucleotidyltransferase